MVFLVYCATAAHRNFTERLLRWGESFTFYPAVPPVLLALAAQSDPPVLGVASRSSAPDIANSLLKQLRLSPPPSVSAPASSSANSSKRALDFFHHVQIFPGDKKQHFKKLQKASGISYDEMLFFDDEARNRNVESLGVVMLLVGNGVSLGEVDRGVREWRRRKGREGRKE